MQECMSERPEFKGKPCNPDCPFFGLKHLRGTLLHSTELMPSIECWREQQYPNGNGASLQNPWTGYEEV